MVLFISSSVKYSKSLNFRKFSSKYELLWSQGSSSSEFMCFPWSSVSPRRLLKSGQVKHIPKTATGQNHWRKAPHSIFPLQETLPHYPWERLTSLCLNIISSEPSPPHNTTQFFIHCCLQRRFLSSELPQTPRKECPVQDHSKNQGSSVASREHCIDLALLYYAQCAKNVEVDETPCSLYGRSGFL